MVQERIKNCIPCQAATQGTMPKPEPLNMTPLPKAPWCEIAIDFVGPFPSGEVLLVVIDEFSRFPEVEILHTTTANAVILKLDCIFSRQGIPKVVKSDNGLPFNSNEFANFASFLGFEHRKVTPYWPQINGKVERFMRTLEKAIRTTHLEKKNWKQEMNAFLRQYRATPHSTTDVSPSQALNGRKIQTLLPQLTEVNQSDIYNPIHEKDSEKKRKMKEHADQRRRSETSGIKVGVVVLIRQPKTNKLSTPFNPYPYKVVARKGSKVTAEHCPHKVTRNVSFFKRIQTTPVTENETDDEADDPIPSAQHHQEQIAVLPPLRRSQRQRQPPNRLTY
ncbi:uncharacterized protein K02A2.6-like [Paramuricea clavata]|uniref:Uncharacterized protein K02A2.6-like n=1 Tax=Paramuricea clavata TaxID=317549 RepID=A0A7D9JYA1_PARCT|nr:uncharacterized protein K02A2.6-like [Paramuricea clavata]